jgi:uncharacterized protein HemX
MYIVPIAWLYVVVIMAASEDTIFQSVMTLILWGALPVGIFVYIFGSPQRRRKNAQREADARQQAISELPDDHRPVEPLDGGKNSDMKNTSKD